MLLRWQVWMYYADVCIRTICTRCVSCQYSMWVHWQCVFNVCDMHFASYNVIVWWKLYHILCLYLERDIPWRYSKIKTQASSDITFIKMLQTIYDINETNIELRCHLDIQHEIDLTIIQFLSMCPDYFLTIAAIIGLHRYHTALYRGDCTPSSMTKCRVWHYLMF